MSLHKFAADSLVANLQTPVLLLKTATIQQQYAALRDAFPSAQVCYAIKANPAEPVVQTLANAGSGFELASRAELDLALRYGADPARLAFGNTIKKRADIAYAYAKGIRLFATDSEADVRCLAAAAPGAKIYTRLLAEPTATADWPLDRKFGCPPETALELLSLARELDLQPYGVSFHVGSQQNSPEPWGQALRRAAWMFAECRQRGIDLALVNLGGGFPVAYLKPVPPIQAYAEAIHGFIQAYFPTPPQLMLEPGRFLVAEAGLLVCEVMLVARKKADEARWVYLDVGIFGGMTESAGEATKYPITTDYPADAPCSEVILAGPTCDGRDILYDRYRYALPDALQQGDKLYFANAGAYTVSCGSVSYNGFAPVAVHSLP